MQRFVHKEKFDCSAEIAYLATTRDFEGLEKYTPNITRIKELVHEKLEDGREHWILELRGDGAIPLIARPVINPERVRVREELFCRREDLVVEWIITPSMLTEYYDCRGVAHIRDTAHGSEITLTGALNITLRHMRGFPDEIVHRGVQILEPFLVQMATRNLHKYYDACRARLADGYDPTTSPSLVK